MRGVAVAVLVLGLACAGESGKKPDASEGAKPKPTEEPKNKPGAAEDEPKAASSPKAEIPKVEEPKEISETRALVIADGELRRLAPSGKTEVIAKIPGVDECDVDEYHRVVWILSRSKIAAYDPSDRKIYPVATMTAPAELDFEFVWRVQYTAGPPPFPMETAGSADGLENCVALVLVVGDEPTVGGAVVGEGDREWYCFEGGDLPSEDSMPPLLAEEAARKAIYDKAKLTDGDYLVGLAARRRKEGMRERPTLVAPEAPKVAIDRSRCDENPEDCGTARYLGGSRLWQVVTDNSRGDFYHETTQLYDSKAAVFWNPETDQRSPNAATDEDEFFEIAASPDGTWGLIGDKILSLGEAKAVGSYEGGFCGWE